MFVKAKVWGHVAFRGWLPKTMLVQEILDAWLNVGTMVGDSPNKRVRVVGFSSTMSPEYRWGLCQEGSKQQACLEYELCSRIEERGWNCHS